MNNQSTMMTGDVASVEFTVSPALMSDASSLAQGILTRAMEYCAQKMGLEGPPTEAVRQVLPQREGPAIGYLRYSIAVCTAEQLGKLDEDARAAYLYEYEATPEDVVFAEADLLSPIHLIVRVARKSSALCSLVAALERTMAQVYAETIGPHTLQQLLDVQIVDDNEVEKQAGYAGLLRSVYHQPMLIWKR
jgi:hypothetical protein